MTIRRRAKYYDCDCVLDDKVHGWVQNQKSLADVEPSIELRPPAIQPGACRSPCHCQYYLLLNVWRRSLFSRADVLQHFAREGHVLDTNEKSTVQRGTQQSARGTDPKCDRFRLHYFGNRNVRVFTLSVFMPHWRSVVFLLFRYSQLHTEWELVRAIGAYVVTCAFVIEAVIKIVGLSFRNYWRSAWNRYDFVIMFLVRTTVARNVLFACSASLTTTMYSSPQAIIDCSFSLLFAIGAIRLLRVSQIIARIAKLPRTAKSIRAGRFFMAMYKIVLTIKIAAPILLNVFIVLIIWVYM